MMETRTGGAVILVVTLVGCADAASGGGDAPIRDRRVWTDLPADNGAAPDVDASAAPENDAGLDAIEAPAPVDPATYDVTLDPDATRPVAILPRADLARIAERMPRVVDPWLRDVLESSDTVFYDRASLTPGYQDSFGNHIGPYGFRPNTIDSGLIDLAVPGGHAQIFQRKGTFHFPFGDPVGSTPHELAVVNFWKPPRGADGAFLPVVHFRREPGVVTHREEWLFPQGTVLGEILCIVDAEGVLWPFEIRTRERLADHYRSDVVRPFPTSESFAVALEAKRSEDPAWASSAELDAFIAHVRDRSTLRAATLDAPHFPGAFPRTDLAVDELPALTDDSILRALLAEAPFRSARDAIWKANDTLHTYAPTTEAAFSIVPRAYTGGFVAVNDESCGSTCHESAGRPFKDWYENILAYGELWGNDDTFTWHPFVLARFVDGAGDVVSFNDDNREWRPDFVAAGLIAPYDPAVHLGYARLPGAWKEFSY